MPGEYLDEEVKEHENKMKAMRERHAAERKAAIEKHEAAMRTLKKRRMHTIMTELDQAMELNELNKRDKEEILAAMQAFETKVAARRVYHEAPDDVFELIVLQLSDVADNGYGRGGLNALRLVSKRCLRVVESVATRLTLFDDAVLLPLAALKRCRRIEHIKCLSLNSLEGCPKGLKSLYIEHGFQMKSLEPLSACKELETINIGEMAYQISDLSPLSSCMRLKELYLSGSLVTDLTPLSSMLLLEKLYLWKDDESSSIEDISNCKRLNALAITGTGNCNLRDLSPLSQCPDLEELNLSDLPLIKDLSFFEKGFTKLRVLYISYLPVEDLSPLTRLQNLEELDCCDIPKTTSLLPLARCNKLKQVYCSRDAMDLVELREKRPDLKIVQCSSRPF